MPGAKEIREVYRFQMEKISAEALQRQVALQEAQLRATAQLSQDVRQALLELTGALERKALASPPLPAALPRPRPYHNLPRPDYGKFVGREKELEWLRQRLSPKDRAWQIALTGIGGVGKSALAIAIAREYQQRYEALPQEERFEAIVWTSAKEEVLTVQGREQANLPGLVMHNLEDVYSAIARALDREDITRALPEEQTGLVQKVLGEQRTLLIMDNLESVTDDRLRPFLRNLPFPTKVIITSREWVDVADVLALKGLTDEEADALISAETLARHVDLARDDRQRIIELTSGLPLPIKLSIARMASGESLEAVARWLGDATADVPEYCVKGQADLVQARDPNAWRLLLACSLFDRSAGAARKALGSMIDVSIADLDKGLAQLQRLFLVNRNSEERYWLLPIVQRYAGIQFERLAEAETLVARWLSWLTTYSQEHGTDLELHMEQMPVMRVEYPNLVSAIRWCNAHELWATLIALVNNTWSYAYLAALFGELEELLSNALEATKILSDTHTQGQIYYCLGRVRRTQGCYDDAIQHLAKAEEIAQQYGDNHLLGHVLHLRADALWYLGDTSQAMDCALEVLKIGESLNDYELRGLAALRLSKFQNKLGNFEIAMEWLDKAENWIRAFGSQRRLAWTIYRRGANLIGEERPLDAEPHLLQALDMALALEERRMIGMIKTQLARVYALTGRVPLALHMGEEARDLFARMGMKSELEYANAFLTALSQMPTA